MRRILGVVAVLATTLNVGCEDKGTECLTGNWLFDNEDCVLSRRIVFNADGTGTYEYNNCDTLCTADGTVWYAVRPFTYTADEEVAYLDYTDAATYGCDSTLLPMLDTVNTVYSCNGDALFVGNVNYKRE